MKEILYIQAGPLANHIGTHFWNTQDSYFTYEEGDDPVVTHDISFREGTTQKGESTYSPRVLLFDRKANFGVLSSTSDLFGEEDEDGLEYDAGLWGGAVLEFRQDRIPKSRYHQQLDNPGNPTSDSNADSAQTIQKPRYWSDYSRVFFHSRSLQRLPDVADWENTEGDWSTSKDMFERHDLETELMEESFRLFAEECNNLQGLQTLSDNASFGGFTDSLLTSIRDEFPRLPSLTFPLLAAANPTDVEVDDDLGTRRAINDALCLRSLDGLSTMNVPLQAPRSWQNGEWLEAFRLDCKSLYQASALLSTHIETITLPLRLKDTMQDFGSLCNTLNWGGGLRFAHLSGTFPLVSPFSPGRDIERRLYDFTVPKSHAVRKNDYSRMYVTRGLSFPDQRLLDNWIETQRPLPQCILAPAFPLPSSYPSYLIPPSYLSYQNGNPNAKYPTTRVLSSLHTTPQTSDLFASYANFVDECTRKRIFLLSQMGLERDEAIELRDNLWAMRDGHAGAEDGDVAIEDVEDLREDEK